MSRTSSAFHRFVTGAIYPVVLFGSCGLAAIGLLSGAGVIATVVPTIGVAMLTLTLLERRMPYAAAWQPNARTVRIDIIHSLVSATIASPLVRISSIAVAAWLGGELSAWLGMSLWPTSLPLVLQVALALAIADFGAYSGHRFMHATALGWRLHAVHHTPTQLYAVAAGRSHPFNALLTMTCESVPVILLGITPDAFALLATFKAINGLLQHSNVAMNPGPLSYVIATCDVHRFHHAADFEESNTNFGNTTMLWDHVFGTFYLPHRQPSATIGIADADIPESYAAHLLTPFRLARYQVGANRPATATPEPVCRGVARG